MQVYWRGEDWYCTFTVEYDAETGDETEIGVDIGHNHLLAAEAENGELMLVSGREAKYVRRKYRSLRESLQQAGALRACNRVVTGRQPLTRDAKAYLTAEETRNLNIPFGESHPFRGGRRSTALH